MKCLEGKYPYYIFLTFVSLPLHSEMASKGVYVPPQKMAQMMSQVTDQNSEEYQRMAWLNLRKAINGLINKVYLPSFILILLTLL